MSQVFYLGPSYHFILLGERYVKERAATPSTRSKGFKTKLDIGGRSLSETLAVSHVKCSNLTLSALLFTR